MKTLASILFLFLFFPTGLQATSPPSPSSVPDHPATGDESLTPADTLVRVDPIAAEPASASLLQRSRPHPSSVQVGQATRGLLRLQASGESAAPMLPMLGQASTAALKRHMDSFGHPIPEFFDTTVEGSDGSR